MAAIHDADNTLNLDDLDKKLQKMLPAYAKPVFIRILSEVPLTGTYKLKKRELQLEGFNVSLVKNPIYFYNSRIKKYELLTNDLYNDIISGAVKL